MYIISGASLVAQNLPAIQETWVRSLGQEYLPGEGNGSPLQYSCLENLLDRGAWQAAESQAWSSPVELAVSAGGELVSSFSEAVVVASRNQSHL